MPTVIAKGMTAEEFLELPDDGIDRELIRGELRERGVTVRNRHHSRCLIELGSALNVWAKKSAEMTVVGGEAGFMLKQDPDTIVGVDLAVVSRDLMRKQDARSSLIRGIPTVAIEILSPSDTQALIRGKTKLYLDHGVAAVWLVDPEERTVRIHRAGQPPQQYNETQRISEIPELPGITIELSQIFE